MADTPTRHSKTTFKDEIARLRYFQWTELFNSEKPYEIISQVPEGIPRSNFSLALGPKEVIHDMRGQESSFDLNTHGFQILRQTLTEAVFDDKASIVDRYLPSLEELLRDTLGPGAETFIFDWRLRSSDPSIFSKKPGVIDLNDPLLCIFPVKTVHVDQSPVGAIKRAKHHMGDRAEKLLLEKRYRIINLWRPINCPVENYPLAVCDGRTVPADKLMAVDHVRKEYVGESLYPLACPDYRWYYLSNQTTDEVLAFKTYDSAEWAPAKCCPHTSFQPSDVPAGARYRESIEVRVLVFTDD